ncbi:peptidoglycan-binding protein [Parasedimentitalea maritima]|uniref:Peptidoglycan binding domain-containing protein n=1 Tax=Parasedimentitalea maritima TaxID=2578117 RepID=A0A6A4RJ53_9RHOB|nr:peptidoglycan-binding protein [Zongyanglinia marina]KAE9629556.1 hypothetical protein GP644_11090 [Zongyanglinia marina]
MPSIQLSAPVGANPRPLDGTAVKNYAKDVSLLRDMLEANGIGPLGGSQKMDNGLIKAINRFQKKTGFKVTDSVVDPGGRTFKALQPKYLKTLKAVEKANKEPLYQIKFKGKTILCNKVEYNRLYALALKNIHRRINSLINHNRILQEAHQEFKNTADFSQDVAGALIHALFVTVGTSGAPKPVLAKKAATAGATLKKLKSSKDLGLIHKQLPQAEQAVQAFAKDMNRFLSQYISGGSNIVLAMEVTQTIGFIALGAIATPIIITAGASLSVATVASAVGTSVLQSSMEEGWKHGLGMTDDVAGSFRKIFFDGAVGGLTSKIPTKPAKKLLSKISGDVTKLVAAQTSLVSRTTIQKYSDKVIQQGGMHLYKSSYEEVIKLVGESAKKGKPPTPKDVDKILFNMMSKPLSGAINKRLGSFFKKVSYEHKDIVTYTMVPERLNKLVKTKKVGATLTAQAHEKIASSVSGMVVKKTISQTAKHVASTLDGAKGTESPEQLTKKFKAACADDKAILAMIDAELMKCLAKK